MDDKDKRTYDSFKEHGNDMSYENEVKKELEVTRKVLKKSVKLVGVQTQLLATLKDKLVVECKRCIELTTKNKNLEEINEAHKKLNGKLQVRLTALEPKGIKLRYDDKLPEEDKTVFGTKV
jgi:phage-related protein